MKTKLSGVLTLLLAFVVQFIFAQEKTISGTISDASGLPLPGTTVLVKGTTNGSSSDFDGKYSIKANTGATLVFSFVGYKPQEILIGASNTINITLLEDTSALDEVVVTAYGGISTLRASSASVSTIKAIVLEDRANASAIQNLQGQVAGLNIGTGTGQPGADSLIILRGPGSINGNIEPLFIVDGIAVNEDNFRTINPNDIDTYTILKDAAAANIYGNRAANGAIVITTKKGKFNQALSFRYTTTFGYNELQDQPFELMNSSEILNFQRTYNEGLGAGLADAEIAAIASQANTNWADIFFRKGTTMSHDLAITSGSENTSNYTSLQYFKQDGIFLYSDLQRFTARNNFNGKTSDNKFNYNINLSLGYSQNNGLDGDGTGSTFFNPFSAALQGLPYLNPYNPDGSITTDGGIAPGSVDAILARGATNFPFVILNGISLNTLKEEEIKILASFGASWNFTKNMTAGIQLGTDLASTRDTDILHPESILGPFQSDFGTDAQFGGIDTEGYTRDFRFNLVNSLGYANTFANKHDFDITAYFEYAKGHLDGINFRQEGIDPRLVGVGAGFISGRTTEVIDGETVNPYIPTVGKTKLEVGNISVFGTLNYTFNKKYGFSASIRRDNSFRFIEENKWGTFWSLAGRWNIDEEAFMNNSSINLLKLRASHGSSGNDRIGSGYYSALSRTRDLFSSGLSYNGSTGTFPSQRANVNLKWETTVQTNFGLDFGVWNNKLVGAIDVYQKTTKDLFQNDRISAINGQSTIDANIGSMVNKGIELDLRYTIYNAKDWTVSVFANGSYNKNEVEKLPPSTDGLVNLGGSTAIGEGEPLGSFYLVKYAGVNPSNGNPLFYTADGGLTETLSDDDRVFTGKSIYPVWQGGFGGSIKYRGFELSNQWSFVADIYRNNLDFADLQEGSQGQVENGRNRSVTLFNAWQTVGDITDIPRINSAFGSVDYINQTDRYLEDASFLRLRNITFGYTLPKKYLENLPINGFRIYVQGENLVTFSKYRGWDPESNFRTTDRGQFPTPKIYTFGATINF